MLGDSVLWSPILDALWGLPDSKIGRGEYVTDLSEYRRPRQSAERSPAPKVSGGTWQPRFSTWFVPFHAERSVVQWTIKSETPAPRPTKGAYAVILLPDEPRKKSTIELTQRELAGMERGERWTIERSNGDVLVRTPLPRIGNMGWYPGRRSDVINRAWNGPRERAATGKWFPGQRYGIPAY